MSDETQLGLIVGIGCIIVAVVGVLVSVYYGRRALKAERALRKLSWPDIQNAAQEMGSKIQTQFRPDLIVTPGLTGATFANLLADEFNWQPPVIVGTRTWKRSKYELIADEDADVIETNKWIVTIPNKAYKTIGNVLIVDDFAIGLYIKHDGGRVPVTVKVTWDDGTEGEVNAMDRPPVDQDPRFGLSRVRSGSGVGYPA